MPSLAVGRGRDRQDAARGRGRGGGARGFVVLHGECLEFGGEELAYAPVVAALRGLRRMDGDWLDELAAEARGALAAVLPRETPGAGGPGRLYELLLDLLGRLAGERRRCCWCSRTSTGPIRRRSRCSRSWPATCATERIVVVATYRVDDELPAELRRLAARARRGGGRSLRIELEPLGRDDVARQLEAIAGRAGPGRARGRAARARGRQPVLRRGAVRGPRRAPGDGHRGGSGAGRAPRPAPRSRCSPRPAGTPRTRCSSASRSRRTRCARRSTPACSCASATASRSGTA